MTRMARMGRGSGRGDRTMKSMKDMKAGRTWGCRGLAASPPSCSSCPSWLTSMRSAGVGSQGRVAQTRKRLVRTLALPKSAQNIGQNGRARLLSSRESALCGLGSTPSTSNVCASLGEAVIRYLLFVGLTLRVVNCMRSQPSASSGAELLLV